VLAIIWKDLVLEARSRETVASLFVLGLLVLVIFNFAVDIAPKDVAEVAPGVLWIAIVFSATLALGRAFAIERENGCMTALVLAPIDRGLVFFAKLLVNVIVLLVFEALLLPFFVLFYPVGAGAALTELVVVLVAGTVGLAAVGTLFALAALGTRARELMLPLLILPLQIPLLIAAVRSTALVLGGAALGDLGAWGTLLVTFDVVFVTAGWLAFEFMVVD
jgi:heme exporter protein B